MLLFVLKRSKPGLAGCRQWAFLVLGMLSALGGRTGAQNTVQADQQPATPANAPVVITLEEALKRAQANEPNFATALANARVAGLDKAIARAALLPSVTYHNEAIYTQPKGQGQGIGSDTFRIIANNGVREYTSQAVVGEAIGLDQIAGLRRADAAAAVATAELEIARRGLVATVVAL